MGFGPGFALGAFGSFGGFRAFGTFGGVGAPGSLGCAGLPLFLAGATRIEKTKIKKDKRP